MFEDIKRPRAEKKVINDSQMKNNRINKKFPKKFSIFNLFHLKKEKKI